MMKVPALMDYRKAEFAGFVKDYLALLDKAGGIAAVADAVLALQESYGRLSADFQQEQADARSAALEALDKQRDACLIGIRGVARYYTLHFEAAKAAAGQALLRSIDHYGKNISALNYQAQTVVVEQLLADWATPDLAAALAELGLAAWADRLGKLNREFATLRQERAEARAADTSETMQVHRPQVLEAYRQLNRLISAHQLIAPDAERAALISAHDALVDEYEAILGRRSARRSPSAAPDA